MVSKSLPGQVAEADPTTKSPRRRAPMRVLLIENDNTKDKSIYLIMGTEGNHDYNNNQV
jgi:hypothetical protein